MKFQQKHAMLVKALKMTGGSPRDFVNPAWMDTKFTTHV